MKLSEMEIFPLFGDIINIKRSLVVFATTSLVVATLTTFALLNIADAGDKFSRECDSRVSDPFNVSSFLPPEEWVMWNFYGKVSFSPRDDKETRIIYLVAKDGEGKIDEGKTEEERTPVETADKLVGEAVLGGGEGRDPAPAPEIVALRDERQERYKKTFSTLNYSLIEIKPVELRGYPGVSVIALGTEVNRLFGGQNIYILEYYTGTHTVSLTFIGSEEQFNKYRDAIDSSFNSLIIF
jgi:hypothetical protein